MKIQERDAVWTATDAGSEARINLDGSRELRIHLSDPCGAVADPAYSFAVAALREDGDVILVWDEYAESVHVPRSIVESAIARLRAAGTR
jgi:hypothetical protein